jgi:hypothetical protein
MLRFTSCIYCRVWCINGRDWHYLCGVIGTEHFFPENGKNRLSCVKDGFHLKLLDRKQCVMYPEEALGGFINSASAQWQVIDALFQGMRDVMRSGTAFTSGTFSIAWTNACQKFWGCIFHMLFFCSPLAHLNCHV